MRLKLKNLGINTISVKKLTEKLENMSYTCRMLQFELTAVRWVEHTRFHISFEVFPDECMHETSFVNIHQDYGTGRFHHTQYTSKAINTELVNISKGIK